MNSRRQLQCTAGAASHRGMTLVELAIVLAVVAILMSLAIPAYTQQSLRVHRSEAIQSLLKAAICQEQVLARTGTYDTSRCLTGAANGRYEISYTAANSQSLQYTATATPLGPQSSDICGALSLDQSGRRTVGEAGISATKCWNGR